MQSKLPLYVWILISTYEDQEVIRVTGNEPEAVDLIAYHAREWRMIEVPKVELVNIGGSTNPWAELIFECDDGWESKIRATRYELI